MSINGQNRHYPSDHSRRIALDSLPEVIAEFDIQPFHFIVFAATSSPEEILAKAKQVEKISKTAKLAGNLHVEEQSYVVIKDTKTFQSDTGESLFDILTSRELQITCFVALGYSNKQIAKRLKLSVWTISAHLRRIFIKLNVDTRAALVYRCASLLNYLQMHHLHTTGQQPVVDSPSNNSLEILEMAESETLHKYVSEIRRSVH
jgi:DNA-binding CsgD family transcriptional regulator